MRSPTTRWQEITTADVVALLDSIATSGVKNATVNRQHIDGTCPAPLPCQAAAIHDAQLSTLAVRSLRWSMPRSPFRVAMFLSSYAPLLALMAYINRDAGGAGLTLALIAAASLLGLAAVMSANRNERGPRLEVEHARPQDGDVLAYITGYLVPFFELDLSKSEDIVVLCAFLLVLMLVYINSNMLFVNPVLSLAGYHSFEIEDPDGQTYVLLARRSDVEPGTVLHPAQVTRYLRVEVRHERPNDSR